MMLPGRRGAAARPEEQRRAMAIVRPDSTGRPAPARVAGIAVLAVVTLMAGACKRTAERDAANELAAIGKAMNATDRAPAANAAEAPPAPDVAEAARALPAIDGYVPRQMVALGDGRVALIGTIEKKDAAHVETGWLSVHYLDRSGSGYKVAGAWPQQAAGNGFGSAPSSWRVSDRLSDNPTVVTEAGYGNQGSFCTWFALTELAPGAPVTSKVVLSGYDDSGFQEDPAKATMLTGIMTNIVKGQSFDVIFNGKRHFTDHYVRQGGKWVLQGPESGLRECLG